MRAMICSDMEALGIDFDRPANDGVKGQDKIISKPGSKATVMTITTDEELVIAMDTKYIVEHHTL
jgi:acetate kinase